MCTTDLKSGEAQLFVLIFPVSKRHTAAVVKKTQHSVLQNDTRLTSAVFFFCYFVLVCHTNCFVVAVIDEVGGSMARLTHIS